jgi:predicted nuclease with TOPRIM domain
MLGLVPVRRYDALRQQVEAVKTSAQEWKAKATDSLARVKQLETELRQRARHVEKFDSYRAKLVQRREQIESLRTRLAEAERELMVAREHLMAVEVKLDILEGAANVLDIRTRAAIAQQHGQTSARV